MKIIPAGARHGADIERLLDEAFGADRSSRTAYRLRRDALPLRALSFVAIDDEGDLAGSVQCWPLVLVAAREVHELTLLGPIAVAERARGNDLGGHLMRAALSAAAADGRDDVLLVGDADYYGRFGFSAEPTGGWSMPGPVERHRLLARLAPGSRLPEAGDLLPVSDARATMPAAGLRKSARARQAAE